MSDLEEVKEKIDELTSALKVINIPTERETELSGKVVALCASIGTNLSVKEACRIARNTRERLAELEAKLDITQVSGEELAEEVCRRMNVSVEDLTRS